MNIQRTFSIAMASCNAAAHSLSTIAQCQAHMSTFYNIVTRTLSISNWILYFVIYMVHNAHKIPILQTPCIAIQKHEPHRWQSHLQPHTIQFTSGLRRTNVTVIDSIFTNAAMYCDKRQKWQCAWRLERVKRSLNIWQWDWQCLQLKQPDCRVCTMYRVKIHHNY